MGVLPNSAMKVHRILCDNHWVTKERGGGMRERAEKKMCPYQAVKRTFD